VTAPGFSPRMRIRTRFQSLSAGLVCAVGFASVIAVMIVLLRPGTTSESTPLPIQLLLYGIPAALGAVTILLAARRLRGARRVIVLILGGLLVVWPVWGIVGAALLSCLVGPLGTMVCD